MPCVSLRHVKVFDKLCHWVRDSKASQANLPERTLEDSICMAPPAPLTMLSSNLDSETPAPEYVIRGSHLYIKHLRPAFSHSANVSDSNLSQLVATKLNQLANIQSSRSKIRANLRTRGDIINAESQFGSTIFGPIPPGHQREFFHDKKNIWIWHESWTDQDKQSHQITVRYEIRPTGIYKKVARGEYLKLRGSELLNFRKATYAYLKVIKEGIYDTLSVNI